jgi:hypothetical protein
MQPLVNCLVRFPFLAPRPPFRAVQPGKQHQNRAGPHDSHREYQCDRFLRAHNPILRATSDLNGEFRPLEERKLPYAKEPAGISAETSGVILGPQR